jgi:OOP family OmpA-OmpF porin
MKKLIYLSIVLLATISFGQDLKEMNKWSAGLSVGGHDGFNPANLYTKAYQIHHYGVNGRYMFNNRFGLMADLGYDFIDATNSGSSNVNYIRTSIQGVANLGDIMRFDTWSSKIGLLAHLGSGWSTMWSPSKKLTDPNDPFIKNSDDMLNIIIGLTPQYKVNEKISLNFDISAVSHIRQNNNFDYSKKVKTPGISGYFFNWSLGATYYIGKKEKHADWIPTVYAPAPKEIDLSKYDAMIKELQDKTKDDDADGVPNYVDTEIATPQGSFVDSKGAALKDADQDGIADEFDACPQVKGLFAFNGCADTDGDGISDDKDICPKSKGTLAENGCPSVSKDVKVIMEKALKGVQFETNKDVLLKTSFKSLNDVVTVLNANPTYRLKISGHTDNVGNDDENVVLSEKRAKACSSYIVSKGIAENRLIVAGFGETKPVATNDTKAGKALNRRVEFTIIFE